MRLGSEHSMSSLRGLFIHFFLIGATLLVSNTVTAATITAGSEMTVLGKYSEGNDGDGDFVTFSTAISGFIATGDLSTPPGITGTIFNDGKVYIDPFSSTGDILEVGGWNLSLNSLTITPSDVLTMSGTGQLYGNEFELTPVNWTFSGGSTYSMTITAVPVPAAVWLFGSGLLGLIAVARRKTA